MPAITAGASGSSFSASEMARATARLSPARTRATSPAGSTGRRRPMPPACAPAVTTAEPRRSRGRPSEGTAASAGRGPGPRTGERYHLGMARFDDLPLFPLGIVLLPGEVVPLHIFEPRYREMIA